MTRLEFQPGVLLLCRAFELLGCLCTETLAALPTSAEEDAAALAAMPEEEHQRLHLALTWRISYKRCNSSSVLGVINAQWMLRWSLPVCLLSRWASVVAFHSFGLTGAVSWCRIVQRGQHVAKAALRHLKQS